MRYHELGTTGLHLSEVALGSAPFGDMFGAVTADDADATVHAALDGGINFFDSSPYYGRGLAEVRLGRALRGHRDEVYLSTKAGRYGGLTDAEFDFSPTRIRASLEVSLGLLGTDYLDVFLLHDIEFGDLDVLLDDAVAELQSLRDAGKIRHFGVSGNPMRTLRRAVEQTSIDVVLSYAHATLLNGQLQTDLLPIAQARGVGVINAAAVSLGLLTRQGLRIPLPATPAIADAARRAVAICDAHDVDVAHLANQYAIQRSGAATTVIGTSSVRHLESALTAAEQPIDEALLDQVLAATADVRSSDWSTGRPENN